MQLEELLQADQSLISDGRILKNAVVERAAKLDISLLRLLMQSEPIRRHFFTALDGIMVFDKTKFLEFVSNKQFLPDSYTSFKNRIGLTDGSQYLKESRAVVLAWPYKDCVLEGGQTREDVGREEIFWNTSLAPDDISRLFEPKVITGFARWDAESVAAQKQKTVQKIEQTDNLVIKGNNLFALHTLRKKFAGKVSLIYIDPPFNTGNDGFKYNDRFNHSTWLTFMKNRLDCAKTLLSQDGNIFIHIDINESHYLKCLCDELFGHENFVEEIIWSYGSPSGGRAAGAKPVNIHDYILHYAKDYKSRKQRKIYTEYSQKYIDDWFKYKDENGRRYRLRQRNGDSKTSEWSRQYLDESPGVPLTTVWSDIKQVYADPRAYKPNQKQHTELVPEFSGQKPEALIKRVIELSTDEGDLVLDFFAGSGTTGVAAMKMRRQFVLVEQIEDQLSTIHERLFETIKGAQSGISKTTGWQGGGTFLYAELAKWNAKLIDTIRDAHDASSLLPLRDQLRDEGYVRPGVELDGLTDEEFDKLTLDEKKRILIDCLEANHFYVNYEDMEDEQYGISEENMRLNRNFHGEEA